MSQRLAYVNGVLVPETEASVSIRDLGLVYGDSVFDTARTFAGKLFKLEEHIDRLYQSLAYARIDAGLSPAEMTEATLELVAANLPVLRPGEDYWVTIRVTGGVQNFDGETDRNTGATVVIDCIPIPLRARAPFFKQGIAARLTDRRRIAPQAINPNTKTNNYLNMILAQKEISASFPGAWALMPDANGNIAEGAGCNFFVVQDDVVLTPTTEFVLAGVSRQVVIDICATLGIPLREQDVPVELALAAQEAFFTSTSLCACPVAFLDGQTYPGGVPGPVTQRIMNGFAEEVGMDFVGQYLNFLSDGPPSTGL
ncbi:MAG: hypothetical protein GJ676_16655 [Rhodobacteraceae bacterium]|nr:hypothetical protein [Paracoccaceae bacterium]